MHAEFRTSSNAASIKTSIAVVAIERALVSRGRGWHQSRRTSPRMRLEKGVGGGHFISFSRFLFPPPFFLFPFLSI